MARLVAIIDDKIEREFRQAVSERMGMKKGNLSIAVEAAIRDWIKKPAK